MKDICIGIYIRDNEVYHTTADMDKDIVIQELKDIADEIFDNRIDNAYVFFNDNIIWVYKNA